MSYLFFDVKTGLRYKFDYTRLSVRHSVPIYGMRVFDDYEEKVRRINDEAINLVPQGLFQGDSGNSNLPESTIITLTLRDGKADASKVQDLERRVKQLKGVSNVRVNWAPALEVTLRST